MKFLKIAITSLVAALLCQSLADAKVVYVNTAAAAAGGGTSWPTACRFLQDALDLTVAGDEVWVAAGTYYPDDGAAVTTGDRTASFTLKQDVKLYGGFAGGETDVEQRNPETHPTILSGGIWSDKIYWSLHVVTLAGNATLEGFTVTKGNANGDISPYDFGAGIYAAPAGLLTLVNCKVLDNTASSKGGAIYASSIVASNCTFSNNTAKNGDAIYSSSSVTAINCSFSGDTVTIGGGAISTSSSVTAKYCTFSGNKSSGGGGAIRALSVAANDCIFTNNAVSGYGGAIAGPVSTTTVIATNCIFSGNVCTNGGGAIYGGVTATNCTFSGNTTGESGDGGAISGGVTAKNCTFSNNSTGYSGGAIKGSVIATNCRFVNNTGGGAIFGPLTATNCEFSGNNGGAVFTQGTNSSHSLITVTNCMFANNTAKSGGAIRASSSDSSGSTAVTVTNCSFFGNTASSDASSYGGAICVGSSTYGYANSPVTATNCAFSGNTASVYGGAIYSYVSPVTAINCTFLNSVANGTGKRGGAIHSSGRVKIFNNIFWHSLAQAQSNLIYITSTGSIRNADVDFPSPLNQAINLIKGGMAAITAEAGAVVSLGDTSVKILSADPHFVNAANPAGADGIWGTADDGLRLQATSLAIDLGLSMFLPVDANDLDQDGNLTELIPVDLVGYDRIQRAALDLGAYEGGDSFQPIGIKVQPLDLTLLKYLEATFTVTASGYGLRYQWYLGNSGDVSHPIPGATSNSYTTAELGATTSYWVRVQNALGFVDSRTATATMVPILITVQPASTLAAIGATASLSVTASGKGLAYQWYQGASGDMSHPLVGADQPVFTTPALSETTRFWVRVTGVYGMLDSDAATVTVMADPVAAALNKDSSLLFAAGGNAAWFAQSATRHDGFAAAQSGVITHSQTSSVQASVTGAGMISFWWNVSSQSGGDYLRFYIDGVEQTGSISGTAGTWAQKTFTVATVGAHTFKWSYTKNSSTSSGSDCGWVDEVVWIPKLITNHPTDQNILSGMGAGLSVSASGTNLSYQWFAGLSGITTSPVTGATGPILTIPALYGTTKYWVKVGNGVGFESSIAGTVTVFPPNSAIANALNSGDGVSYFTWGSMPWIVQAVTTHDGVSAMQSGAISHAQTSVVEAVVGGYGTLSFWWKVSSELGFDFLRFSIDGVEQGSLSGEIGWQHATFNLPGAGVHKLKWVYVKDESKTSGSDRGWLDQVSWQAASAATTYPTWVAGYNLSGANALVSANPAGDGISNLVKYALRLDPTLPALAPTDGTHAGLPLMERAGGSMRFTFIKDTGKTDVSYTVEACGDLATWQPVTAGVVETPLPGTLVRVEVAIPVAGRRFCRLRVER